MSAIMPKASSSQTSGEQQQTKTIYIPANTFEVSPGILRTLTNMIIDGSMDNHSGFLLDSHWYNTAKTHHATLPDGVPRSYYEDDSCLENPKAKCRAWLKITFATQKHSQYNEEIYPVVDAVLYTPKTILDKSIEPIIEAAPATSTTVLEDNSLFSKAPLSVADFSNYKATKEKWFIDALAYVQELSQEQLQKMQKLPVSDTSSTIFILAGESLPAFFTVTFFAEENKQYIRIIDDEFGKTSLSEVTLNENDTDLWYFTLRMLDKHILSLWHDNAKPRESTEAYDKHMQYSLSLIKLWAEYIGVVFEAHQRFAHKSDQRSRLLAAYYQLSSKEITRNGDSSSNHIDGSIKDSLLIHISCAENRKQANAITAALNNLKSSLGNSLLTKKEDSAQSSLEEDITFALKYTEEELYQLLSQKDNNDRLKLFIATLHTIAEKLPINDNDSIFPPARFLSTFFSDHKKEAEKSPIHDNDLIFSPAKFLSTLFSDERKEAIAEFRSAMLAFMRCTKPMVIQPDNAAAASSSSSDSYTAGPSL